ncbi:MAG: M15 family metallopeptidase [Cytophagales bacterium]|nr:M15 family metallopeptidase [Armatimonadota bacterium]
MNLPIPPLSEPPNWGRLPIAECAEPLVPLVTAGRLRIRALYAEQGIPGAPATVWVRAGVWERLHQALATLPQGVALTVFDGYRPLAVQQWLWDDFSARIRRERPGLSREALDAVVRQFVALPQADPLAPPPHRTGGAVDVYLVDTAANVPLPMGTDADEAAPASATGWFETHPQEPFTSNRRLLFHAMIGAGFANYLGEWWHYEYGNQRWANATGAPAAIYGIAPDPAAKNL